MNIDFDVLKYIKTNFDIPISMYFKCSADDSTKKPAENLNLYISYVFQCQSHF